MTHHHDEALSRWVGSRGPLTGLDQTPNKPASPATDAVIPTTSEAEDPLRVREPSGGYWPDELPRIPLRYLYGGTPKMREAGEAFLPREGETDPDTKEWRGETSGEYARRLFRSTLYGYLRGAVKTTRGKMLRKPIVLENVPDELAYLESDADGDGTSLQSFGGDLAERQWLDGIDYIFVDRPRSDGKPENREDERRLLGEPYFQELQAPALIGQPRRVRYRGKSRIGQCRILFEREVESESRFHSDSEPVVRVYEAGNPDADPGTSEMELDDGTIVEVNDPTLPSWEDYALRDDPANPGREVWTLIEGPVSYSIPAFPGETEEDHRIRQAFFIPLVDLGIGPRPWMRGGQPPLEMLGHLEICHWQKQSDLDNIEHAVNLPRPYATGIDDPDTFSSTQAGAYRMYTLQEANAKLGFMEIEGAGVKELKESIRRLELRMKQESAEPEVGQVLRQETATGRVIDAETAASPLEAGVINLEDSIELAYRYAGYWKGIELPDEFRVRGNRDLAGTALEFERLRIALEIAKLPPTTPTPILRELIEAAIRAGVFPAETDVEELIGEIRAASPALADTLSGLEGVVLPSSTEEGGEEAGAGEEELDLGLPG